MQMTSPGLTSTVKDNHTHGSLTDFQVNSGFRKPEVSRQTVRISTLKIFLRDAVQRIQPTHEWIAIILIDIVCVCVCSVREFSLTNEHEYKYCELIFWFTGELWKISKCFDYCSRKKLNQFYPQQSKKHQVTNLTSFTSVENNALLKGIVQVSRDF